MVGVDEVPKERERVPSETLADERDAESQRTFDHHPLVGTSSLFPAPLPSPCSLLFSVRFCSLSLLSN